MAKYKCKISKNPTRKLQQGGQLNYPEWQDQIFTSMTPLYEKGGVQEQSIGSSFPIVDKKDATVEAEKGELIWTIEDELYKIGGKTHEKGGSPIAAQNGDFIFSDNIIIKEKNLQMILPKIKDNSKLYKKGMTPAKLASKFLDLNEYKSKLDSDDPFTRKTAELMMTKYFSKMAEIAFAQEMNKDFKDGFPSRISEHIPILAENDNPSEKPLYRNGGKVYYALGGSAGDPEKKSQLKDLFDFAQGKKYQYGHPTLDCSGGVCKVIRDKVPGYKGGLPGNDVTAADLASVSKEFEDRSSLKTGDLVFFNTGSQPNRYKGIDHVGIIEVIDGKQYIHHLSSSNKGYKMQPLDEYTDLLNDSIPGFKMSFGRYPEFTSKFKVDNSPTVYSTDPEEGAPLEPFSLNSGIVPKDAVDVAIKRGKYESLQLEPPLNKNYKTAEEPKAPEGYEYDWTNSTPGGQPAIVKKENSIQEKAPEGYTYDWGVTKASGRPVIKKIEESKAPGLEYWTPEQIAKLRPPSTQHVGRDGKNRLPKTTSVPSSNNEITSTETSPISSGRDGRNRLPKTSSAKPSETTTPSKKPVLPKEEPIIRLELDENGDPVLEDDGETTVEQKKQQDLNTDPNSKDPSTYSRPPGQFTADDIGIAGALLQAFMPKYIAAPSREQVDTRYVENQKLSDRSAVNDILNTVNRAGQQLQSSLNPQVAAAIMSGMMGNAFENIGQVKSNFANANAQMLQQADSMNAQIFNNASSMNAQLNARYDEDVAKYHQAKLNQKLKDIQVATNALSTGSYNDYMNKMLQTSGLADDYIITPQGIQHLGNKKSMYGDSQDQSDSYQSYYDEAMNMTDEELEKSRNAHIYAANKRKLGKSKKQKK